ncbi:MAG: dihydroorotase [Dehalococcoidia bacterium]|nr:dihydroorotase [Dehalococcoidia bacterium]
MRPVLIRGGRVIDPAQSLDQVSDVLLRDGLVAAVGPNLASDEAEVIEAAEQVVSPGFIDLHCHLRQPGYEDKETIATGTAAAAAGGFTTVCCMPNTKPVLDVAPVLEALARTVAAEGRVRVHPIAAVTREQAGRELVEMAELADVGVVGFSDDGSCVADSGVMRRALEYSLLVRRPIIQHAEDTALSRDGVMHEGSVSARLGLPGWPGPAEEVIVARDIALAEITGAHVHVAHVSSAGSVDLIRRAKEQGLHVTAEVTPHHLTLTDDLVAGHWWSATASLPPFDTRTKVNPPLRPREDVDALIAGLRDGTIDAIATDHAPHTTTDKECEYDQAAFGISVLETALGSVMSLVQAEKLPLARAVEALTSDAAKVFGLPGGSLEVGSAADVTIVDPEREWCVDTGRFRSLGRNTPLDGVFLPAQVTHTLVGGELVFRLDDEVAP